MSSNTNLVCIVVVDSLQSRFNVEYNRTDYIMIGKLKEQEMMHAFRFDFKGDKQQKEQQYEQLKEYITNEKNLLEVEINVALQHSGEHLYEMWLPGQYEEPTTIIDIRNISKSLNSSHDDDINHKTEENVEQVVQKPSDYKQNEVIEKESTENTTPKENLDDEVSIDMNDQEDTTAEEDVLVENENDPNLEQSEKPNDDEQEVTEEAPTDETEIEIQSSLEEQYNAIPMPSDNNPLLLGQNLNKFTKSMLKEHGIEYPQPMISLVNVIVMKAKEGSMTYEKFQKFVNMLSEISPMTHQLKFYDYFNQLPTTSNVKELYLDALSKLNSENPDMKLEEFLPLLFKQSEGEVEQV